MERIKLTEAQYNRFGMEMTREPELWLELGEQYGIPPSEIAHIDFNRSGVFLPNNEVREDFRVRFRGIVLDDYESWYALPVRSPSDTPFRAENNKLYFNNLEIGSAEELMLDTCESSYQRGPNLLNLNSRSRSNCGGCQACVHNYKNLYDGTVIKDSLPLKTEEDIDTFFDSKGIDISKLEQIAVVTGLFGSEESVVEHIKLVSKVAGKRGFHGEIMYFGCEVNSDKALDELAQIDNFALIYALDNFTKRDRLLAKTKSLITIDDANMVLKKANDRGIETTISYISGIDPVFDMGEGFLKIRENLTRFPIVNIYQIQTKGQANILDESAKKLEYFIQSRVILEDIFSETGLIPKRWENYRPLWYKYFGNDELKFNSYGDN